MEKINRILAQQEFDETTQCRCKYRYGNEGSFLPHCHEFYEIFVTVTNSVKHWVNGKSYELPEGSLVFIRPDDCHTYIHEAQKNTQSEYINLSFSVEMADCLFSYLSASFPSDKLLSSPTPPTTILNPTAKKRVISQLNSINTLNPNDKTSINLYVRSLLTDIFVQYFYLVLPISTSTYPLWFSMLLKEMEQTNNFVAGAEKMVELSKKSRDHVARTVRKHLNLSLTEYVNNLRVNYAANLLLNSNYSIVDICFLCGFQNLGYFYKVFKQNYHLSPAQFAKKHNNEFNSQSTI